MLLWCYRSKMEFEIKFNDIMKLCNKKTNIDDFKMTTKSLFKLKRQIYNDNSTLEIMRLKRAYDSFLKIKSKFLETNEYWKTLTFTEYAVCTGIYECFKSYVNTVYMRFFNVSNLKILWIPRSKCKFSNYSVDFDLSKNCSNKTILTGNILLSPIINSSLPKGCGIDIVLKCGKYGAYYTCLESTLCICGSCECSKCLSIPLCLEIRENKDFDVSIYMLLTNKEGKMTVIDKISTNVEKLKCFSDTCSICMEKFDNNELEIQNDKCCDVFVTSCGHAFHKKCVRKGSKHLFEDYVRDEECINSECTHNLFEDDEDDCPKVYFNFKCPNCRVVS